MKELLSQITGMDAFTLIVSTMLTIWLSVLTFYVLKKDKKSPLVVNEHTQKLLDEADKAMEAADRYMKEHGYPIIISENELKKQEKKTRKQIKKINKKLGV